MMSHVHGTGEVSAGEAPATEGRLIHWARWYDLMVSALTLGRSRSLRRQEADLAGIRPGERVLDVGCGTGDLTLAAAARAGASGEVVGIDASPEMIEVARSKAARRSSPVHFELAPIEHLPFEDGSFDVALSSLMLHHLPGPLKQAGLAEVYRVLRPGGRLLVVDMRDAPQGLSGHMMLMFAGHGRPEQRPPELSPLLQSAGFSIASAGRLAGGMLAYAVGRKGDGHA